MKFIKDHYRYVFKVDPRRTFNVHPRSDPTELAEAVLVVSLVCENVQCIVAIMIPKDRFSRDELIHSFNWKTNYVASCAIFIIN